MQAGARWASLAARGLPARRPVVGPDLTLAEPADGRSLMRLGDGNAAAPRRYVGDGQASIGTTRSSRADS